MMHREKREWIHVCMDCRPKFYENRALDRKSLGDCVECGLKTVGFAYDKNVLVRKKNADDA